MQRDRTYISCHCIDQSIHKFFISCTNTPFTQGLRPLCLPCATTKLARLPLKAQRRPRGCLGHSGVAQRTLKPRHGCHGRREVLSMFKTVAQRSSRRLVAHRSLKGGRRKAYVSPWLQNRCTGVGHWSPRPIASIERSLWRPLCLHSATTATLEPPWQWFCLHSASFVQPVVPLHQFWWFKEAQGSCCSSYTETELSGFGRPLSVLIIFLVAQRWHEGCNPV